MNSIKAIFFDFDETLVGTNVATEAAYERIRDFLDSGRTEAPADKDLKPSVTNQLQPHEVIDTFRHGLKSTPNADYKTRSSKEIRSELWEQALLQSIKKEAKQQISGADVSDLAAKLYEIWNEARLKNMKMLETVTEDMLLALRKKHTLVLITNGSSAVQWEKIQQTDMKRFFDHIIVSGDEEHDKPHISIFQKACSMCSLQPNQCIMVGDNLDTDILGANMAGLSGSVLYSPNTRVTPEVSSDPLKQVIPTHTITSIAQLPSILAAL